MLLAGSELRRPPQSGSSRRRESLHRRVPIGLVLRKRDAYIVGHYVSYVQVWQARGLSVHKKTLAASGRGQSEGRVVGG